MKPSTSFAMRPIIVMPSDVVFHYLIDTATPCLLLSRCPKHRLKTRHILTKDPAPNGNSRKWREGSERQYIHFLDWVLVNGTNRRFRRVGRPAFFSLKTFILCPSTLSRLHSDTTAQSYGSYTFLYCNDDPSLIVRNIRHIYLPYISPHCLIPQWWENLAPLLNIFPRLRHVSFIETERSCIIWGVILDRLITYNAPHLEALRGILVTRGLSQKVAFSWALMQRNFCELVADEGSPVLEHIWVINSQLS